eukprot:TRINITY_DN76562_c0_g1_i1.p1 TRINITY_DN76562_c0_g1~~TRINITY_DN76562_c0_g1_i1.p1  ORF type:complete len:186 (-),score=49.24 TRINITY_DN76562_c0_g1_i1:54-545(-)
MAFARAAAAVGRRGGAPREAFVTARLLRPASSSWGLPRGARGVFTEVSSAEHYADLLKEKRPTTLAYFTAPWCQPCRDVEPHVKELGERLGRRTRLLRVDVQATMDVAQAASVEAVPHFVIYRGGHLVERLLGCGPEAVEAALLRHVALEEEALEASRGGERR